jgi:hypothetical protein
MSFIHLFREAVTVSKDKPPNGVTDNVIKISLNYLNEDTASCSDSRTTSGRMTTVFVYIV